MSKYGHTSSNDKIVFWIIGAISLIALVLIAFVALGESRAQVQISSYQTNATSRPKATVAQTFADFGNMKVADQKTVEFEIINTGDKPLQLFNISSSCGCTTGQITIKEEKSPLFSMHSKSNWSGNVAPGEKARVSLTYLPSLMPVKGDITRSVYVSTNDPDNKELTFNIKAFVE